MTDTPILSASDQARLRRRKRRAAKLQMREAYFQALADGFTQEEIAQARGVSVATVRREIDRAIAARQVRGVEAHVRLQIARATKALALLDMRIGAGETAAVGPYLKTLAALDRYHGLDATFVPAAPGPTRRGRRRCPRRRSPSPTPPRCWRRPSRRRPRPAATQAYQRGLPRPQLRRRMRSLAQDIDIIGRERVVVRRNMAEMRQTRLPAAGARIHDSRA